MSNYKVAYYIRASISEQSKGYSLQGQKSTLDEWIKDMGWKWVKTYCEETNTKDTNREKFQEMITDAKHGLFDGICIIDSDRFSRSTIDLLNIIDDLNNYKIKLHIHNLQQIDIYTQQGRLLLTNLATYSEFFRGQLALKIRVGVKQKMKNEWFGQAPYGYTQVSDIIGNRKKNTHLIENPEEQKILKKMKELREAGKSYNEIATYLNEKDVKTRLTRDGNKCSWHPSSIRNIIMRTEVILNNKEEKT
jgi:site-specific DNA recombinase